MTNKCDNCIHNSVCKYKEKYLKALKDFQDGQGIKSIYEYPIKIEINCYQYLNEYYNFSKNVEKSNISTTTNPCDGCDIYEEMKQGKMVVNDKCSFCSKNLFKITCGDTYDK